MSYKSMGNTGVDGASRDINVPESIRQPGFNLALRANPRGQKVRFHFILFFLKKNNNKLIKISDIGPVNWLQNC